MNVTLPTGFDEWPEDAQRHFLRDARGRNEIVQLTSDSLGLGYDINEGAIPQDIIVDIFLKTHGLDV